MPQVDGKFVLCLRGQKLRKFTFNLRGPWQRKPLKPEVFPAREVFPPTVKGVGFSGTRASLTRQQKDVLKNILPRLMLRHGHNALHHGDCVGADEYAHKLAQKQNATIFLHIPTNSKNRAWCKGGFFKYAKPYLARNRDIVDESWCLVAAPNTQDEVERSGTWSTVRYARQQKRRIFIVLPNGAMHSEFP